MEDGVSSQSLLVQENPQAPNLGNTSLEVSGSGGAAHVKPRAN